MKNRKIINLVLLLAAVSVVTVFAFFVRLGAAADAVTVLKAGGMTCGSCAGRIEKALTGKPGVASVEVDVDAGRVVVAYDSKVTRPESLAESITGIGYGSRVMQTLSPEEYKALTGRELGAKKGAATGCPCCSKK